MGNLLNKVLGDKSDIPSLVNNPFSRDCINSITLRTYKTWRGDFTTYALIEFKNGATKGEQEIEASSLTELLLKIYEFCNTLPE